MNLTCNTLALGHLIYFHLESYFLFFVVLYLMLAFYNNWVLNIFFCPFLQLWWTWYRNLAEWQFEMGHLSSWSCLSIVMSASSCCLPFLNWKSISRSTGQSDSVEWTTATTVDGCPEKTEHMFCIVCEPLFLELKHAVFWGWSNSKRVKALAFHRPTLVQLLAPQMFSRAASGIIQTVSLFPNK